jgi:protein involved in polysaccharide export with SLBB domain
MLKHLIAKTVSKPGFGAEALPFRPASLAVVATLGLALCIAASGCGTKPLPPIPPPANDTNSISTNSLTLHEGDAVQVKFPGAPELDTVQTIRSDGKITIVGAGDVKISGLTTDQAGQALLAAVGNQIKVKEVTVTVQSSAFIIYITGSVSRPGKLVSDRPLTVWEAVIQSGIDSSKSNLKYVKIIRINPDGKIMYKTLNLQRILNGEEQSEPFTLMPYDTIVVPEKFSWF